MGTFIERSGWLDIVRERHAAGDDAVAISDAVRAAGGRLSVGTIQAWIDGQDYVARIRGPDAGPPPPDRVSVVGRAERPPLTIVEPVARSGRGLVELVHVLLEVLDGTTGNAAAVLEQRMREHMRGDGPFPTEEIKGLKLLKELLASFRAFSEAEFQASGRRVSLGRLDTVEDVEAGLAALTEAAGEGRLTGAEVKTFQGLLEQKLRVLAVRLTDEMRAAQARPVLDGTAERVA